MNYKNILVASKNAIATVKINRSKKLNALNRETIQELHNVFESLDSDKAVSVIILTGSGEKAFVAGADIAEFADYSTIEGKKLAEEGQHLLFNFIENLATPVIAAINGFALGGGLELAMACHFRVASPNAKVGLPEVSLGVIPGYGGTQRLPMLIGKGRAMELILTAGMIDAEQALQYGLVNHLVPQEELLAFCKKIAGRITNNSSVAITQAIKAINEGFTSNNNGYTTEIEAFASCFGTADFKEGTTAFLEKRKAVFPGK